MNRGGGSMARGAHWRRCLRWLVASLLCAFAILFTMHAPADALKPITITSLGTVPFEIPDGTAGGMDGWQLKRRGLTRSLAFWLNQGASFVLLHSAYEPGSPAAGEMAHSLIPHDIIPAAFRWQDAPPLVTLRAFVDALAGAKPIAAPAALHFRYSLSPDPLIVPPSGRTAGLRASDAVALLTFQLDERKFAVAAYVVSPNIAVRLTPMRMVLQIDREVTNAGVLTSQPYLQARGKAMPVAAGQAPGTTTISFDIQDDVTWLTFETK